MRHDCHSETDFDGAFDRFDVVEFGGFANFDTVRFQNFINRFARWNVSLEQYEVFAVQFFSFDFFLFRKLAFGRTNQNQPVRSIETIVSPRRGSGKATTPSSTIPFITSRTTRVVREYSRSIFADGNFDIKFADFRRQFVQTDAVNRGDFDRAADFADESAHISFS